VPGVDDDDRKVSGTGGGGLSRVLCDGVQREKHPQRQSPSPDQTHGFPADQPHLDIRQNASKMKAEARGSFKSFRIGFKPVPRKAILAVRQPV
jgi:hypothetical protein